jgi:hypothetical protein
MGSLEVKLARRKARKLVGHRRKFGIMKDETGKLRVMKLQKNLPKKEKKQ